MELITTVYVEAPAVSRASLTSAANRASLAYSPIVRVAVRSVAIVSLKTRVLFYDVTLK